MGERNQITPQLLLGTGLALSFTITAGFSWLSVLVGWCVGGLVSLLVKGLGDQIRGILAMPAALAVIIAGLLVAENGFSGGRSVPIIALGLAFLLYVMWKCPGAGYAGSIAGKVVLGVLLILVLCAAPDVKWETPRWPKWQEVGITLLITTPWWRRMEWKWYGLTGIASTAVSFVTQSILGSGAIVTARPFLRAVETIHMRGILQRLEGFYAVGVLIGGFCLVYYGGKMLTEESKQRKCLILILALAATAAMKMWQ